MGNVVTVDFRQDTIFAVERDDGVFVAIKPICESLGLNWSSQLQRLKEDPILSEGMATVTIPSVGGAQETTVLKLELVNGWLFKVDSRRVKDEETRQKVLTYQRECFNVLFAHFYGKRRVEGADSPEHRPFPDWPMEEMRTKRSVVDLYRLTYGPLAAQWISPQVGFPVPPVETVEIGRQGSFNFPPREEREAA